MLATLAEAKDSRRCRVPGHYEDKFAHVTVEERPLDPRIAYLPSVKRMCILPFLIHVSNGFVTYPRSNRKISYITPLRLREP
jgi:hypothetical protein